MVYSVGEERRTATSSTRLPLERAKSALTYWNFSGLELANPRPAPKSSVSGTKSWYLSVHAWRLSATDDRLRVGASDCRRPRAAKLALVVVVVVVVVVVGAAVLPVATAAPPSAPSAILWRRLFPRRGDDEVDVDIVTNRFASVFVYPCLSFCV